MDVAGRALTVQYAGGSLTRQVRLPDTLAPALELGGRYCAPGDYVFTGASAGRPITPRTVERMVKRAARSTGLEKDVCCMTLRHSYIVDSLRRRVNPREVQLAVGHRSIETTVAYYRYLAAEGVISPADALHLVPTEPASPPPAAVPETLPPPPELPPVAEPPILPFRQPAPPASRFLTFLRTTIFNRFGALRRACRSP